MEIDPIEVIVQWLKTALTTVQQRVAAKHRYGEGWAEDVNGVSVYGDGGQNELYGKLVRQRLELRLYATGTTGVMAIWKELKSLSRNSERFVVATSSGDALVHCFYPESELSLLYDDVLNKDLGVVFFEAQVSEEAVA